MSERSAMGVAGARSWRGLWRMPAILASTGLLIWVFANSARHSAQNGASDAEGAMGGQEQASVEGAIADASTEELDAMLGRAAGLAKQGEHDTSHAEFAGLAGAVAARTDGAPDVVERVVEKLSQCHDQALATGDALLAQRYIDIARLFRPLEELPAGILERLGSTNQLCAARTSGHDAREHLIDGAAAWQALASSLRHEVEREEEWMRAMSAAGECREFAGDYAAAIDIFAMVRAWRSLDNSAGLMAAAREAQCLAAAERTEESIALYETVLLTHPDHPVATACHVPLSCAYQIAGMPAKAEVELRRVVDGRTTLTPDAIDYREALIALADFYYVEGRFREAIEEYSAALSRYPLDARGAELRLRLAESFLGNAEQIDAWLAVAARPEADIEPVRRLRDEQLREGLRLFESLQQGAFRPLALEGAAACAFKLGQHELAKRCCESILAESDDPTDRAVARIAISNCSEAPGEPVQDDEWRARLYASLWSSKATSSRESSHD